MYMYIYGLVFSKAEELNLCTYKLVFSKELHTDMQTYVQEELKLCT